jgi:hypothetical protein
MPLRFGDIAEAAFYVEEADLFVQVFVYVVPVAFFGGLR